MILRNAKSNVANVKILLMDRELKLKMWIEQKQSRIDSGIITNSKTLKYAKKDIKMWKKELKSIT